jgi:hypothetical protein
VTTSLNKGMAGWGLRVGGEGGRGRDIIEIRMGRSETNN